MKHKNYNPILQAIMLTAIFMIAACSPNTRITGSWINPQAKGKPVSGKSVFVASLSRSIEVRNTIENALADAAAQRNIRVIKSTSYFSPDFYQSTPTREVLLSRISKTGAGSIMTVALINKESETRYVPGQAGYAPFPTYRWYGGFYSYYNYWRGAFYEPGYYVTDKTYFMETNIYDVASDQLVWSAQSETVNPGSIDRFAKEYPKVLIERMIKDGLLQP